MVDQDDIYLDVKINYNNNQMTLKQKDLPTSDEVKNFIMKNLDIPNTKDYLTLSYKDDKGSIQKIEDGENFFNYAQKKENNHKEEYILELDLKVDDKINKFKQFFKGGIDENKYNQHKNELDKLKKENKIIKKEKEEMEKSKNEELEKLKIKIIELKMKLTKREKLENNKLKKELFEKELENQILKKYINDSFKEKINKFIENKKRSFKVEAKSINEEIIKNQDNVFKNIKSETTKYINDLNSGMKDLNEKYIKLSKSASQQMEKDSEKSKSLNSSNKKDSNQNNPKLKGKNGNNLDNFIINKDNEQNNEIGPSDNYNYKHINSNKIIINNINDDKLINGDEFYILLNELFFNTNIKDVESKLINFISKFKNTKEISFKKYEVFNTKIILQKQKDKNYILSKKNDLSEKAKLIAEIIKSFEAQKQIDQNKTNNYQNLANSKIQSNNKGNKKESKNFVFNNNANISANQKCYYPNNNGANANPSVNINQSNTSNKRHYSTNYNYINMYNNNSMGFPKNEELNFYNFNRTGHYQRNNI